VIRVAIVHQRGARNAEFSHGMRERMNDIHALTDSELLSSLDASLASERKLVARVLAILIEVEERRLHLLAGHSSMFGFCMTALGMTEGEAFRRIAAARLAKTYPTILDLVASGALHLSGLVLLRDHLTPENHTELLAEASGKSKKAIEALLAARAPRPDVPEKIRRLPDPPARALALDTHAAPAPRPTPPARVEPLSAASYKVQFTASQTLKDKLDRAKNLLSHAKPSGDLAVLMERAMDALIAELEKTRRAKTKNPRASEGTQPGTISRATRREVFERDGEQCGYVSETGQRCQERAFLQLDHDLAKGRGGSDKTKNLRVRCAAHNRLLAEQTYGRAHVEKAKHLRQQKSKRPPDERFERLLGALTGLGFRPKESREALERIRSGSEVEWGGPIEVIVRRAVQMLS
jgi:hypothetical protein